MENELTDSQDKSMTVKDISVATGFAIKTVQNAIGRLFPYLKRQGITTVLTEEQVAEVSKELKRSHNTSLATTGEVVTTNLEMRQRIYEDMQWMVSEIENQRRQIEELEPKAITHDYFIRSNKEMSIRDAAKHFGYRQSETFGALRSNNYLTQSDLPAARAVQENILIIREVPAGLKADGTPRFRSQAVVRADQLDNFRKVLVRYLGDRNE